MHHGKITKTIAQGLRVLKDRIAQCNVPPSQLDETLNIATWSIRCVSMELSTPIMMQALQWVACGPPV